MKNEFKIITLGDIFKNIETEEKAFKFKDYIKDIQQENKRLQSIIKEVREWILFQQEHSMEPYIATDMLDDILEILDKGE